METTNDYTISEIDDTDRHWIGFSVQNMIRLIDERSFGEVMDYFDPGLLDRFFGKCLEEYNAGRLDKNILTFAFGCGLGEYLVRKLGFRWVLFSDSRGSDLAVADKEKKLVVFPISSTRKRFEVSEAEGFTAIADTVLSRYSSN
ncbi:MAG: DUF3806 domain-containing protein [Bacteroidota bacterium]